MKFHDLIGVFGLGISCGIQIMAEIVRRQHGVPFTTFWRGLLAGKRWPEILGNASRRT